MICGPSRKTARTATRESLQAAVHRHQAVSPAGFSERLFTLLFRGLVYPQIWEDPEADLKALALEPNHRLVTIASGGCNALSYLAAEPAEVIAVDLNGAHIALGALKQAAIKRLDYAAFRRFFAEADCAENVAVYDVRAQASARRRDLSLLGVARSPRAAAHRRILAELLPLWPARPFHSRRASARARLWRRSHGDPEGEIPGGAKRDFCARSSRRCSISASCAGSPSNKRRCSASAFLRRNTTRWRRIRARA